MIESIGEYTPMNIVPITAPIMISIMGCILEVRELSEVSTCESKNEQERNNTSSRELVFSPTVII